MNNPYASPDYAQQPTGGFGAPTGQPMYREQNGAQASETSVDMLRQTKPWVTFLSVMGFISTGLMLFAGVGMILVGAIAPSGASPFPPALFGVMYLPMAFVYIYPSLKLWSYSGAIGRLMATRSMADLEAALAQQKSFWKFVAILTIAMMVLYVLLIAGVMVAGVALGSHR